VSPFSRERLALVQGLAGAGVLAAGVIIAWRGFTVGDGILLGGLVVGTAFYLLFDLILPDDLGLGREAPRRPAPERRAFSDVATKVFAGVQGADRPDRDLAGEPVVCPACGGTGIAAAGICRPCDGTGKPRLAERRADRAHAGPS
jgi:hypothetical protein